MEFGDAGGLAQQALDGCEQLLALCQEQQENYRYDVSTASELTQICRMLCLGRHRFYG
jgi:hypothetical protein